MKSFAIIFSVLLFSCEAGLVEPQISAKDLSENEIASLQFMREEEKLARDVYLELYDEWGLQQFTNIAASEQKHTDAVKNLLESYQLTDPVADDQRGVFVNQDLQQLYDDLVAAGKAGSIEALKVGALIEEVDLVDLEDQSAQIDNASILHVYSQLAKGSRNHLRAYVSALEAQGVVYEPEYLDLDTYTNIVTSEVERGRS